MTAERGFGGACLPKDLDGLVAAARTVGHRPSLLEEVADYNRRIRTYVRDEAVGDGRARTAGDPAVEASYARFGTGPSREESGNGAAST